MSANDVTAPYVPRYGYSFSSYPCTSRGITGVVIDAYGYFCGWQCRDNSLVYGVPACINPQTGAPVPCIGPIDLTTTVTTFDNHAFLRGLVFSNDFLFPDNLSSIQVPMYIVDSHGRTYELWSTHCSTVKGWGFGFQHGFDNFHQVVTSYATSWNNQRDQFVFDIRSGVVAPWVNVPITCTTTTTSTTTSSPVTSTTTTACQLSTTTTSSTITPSTTATTPSTSTTTPSSTPHSTTTTSTTCLSASTSTTVAQTTSTSTSTSPTQPNRTTTTSSPAGRTTHDTNAHSSASHTSVNRNRADTDDDRLPVWYGSDKEAYVIMVLALAGAVGVGSFVGVMFYQRWQLMQNAKFDGFMLEKDANDPQQ